MRKREARRTTIAPAVHRLAVPSVLRGVRRERPGVPPEGRHRAGSSSSSTPSHVAPSSSFWPRRPRR